MAKFPTIKIAIIFILGILFQYIFNITHIFYLVALILILIVLSIFGFIERIRNKRIINSLILLLIFCLSGGYFSYANINQTHYPFNSPKIRNAKVIGTVESIDLIKNKKLAINLILNQVNDSAFSSLDNIKFACNFWRDTTINLDSIYNSLIVGNSIKFSGTISRAKNERNPGEFNYEEFLFNKGISGVINCYKIETIKISNHENYFLSNIIFSTRKWIDNTINSIYDNQSASLLKGILLADRSDIDYKIKNNFVNSGVIHVLAVSGLHVGFISGIFFLLFARFHIRKKYILTIVGIILFLILTGGHPSVFRASTMAIVYLIARLTNRSTNGFNSLAIAAIIILLLNPKELLSPGFLLSFSAVLSILIIYPILSEKVKNLRTNNIMKKILLFFSVSLAAQLGTLPLTLIYFNKLSIVALLANLFVIPVIGIIVAIGILSIATSPISLWLANTIVLTNDFLINSLYWFIEYTSNLSFSFLPVYNFSLFDSFIFYVFLGLILFLVSVYKSKIVLFISVVLLMFSFGNIVSLDDKNILPSGEFSVVAIDVGQGDSFLLKFPNNKIALIDAGNSTEYFDNGTRVIYPLIKKLGIDSINYAFISHLDSDHYAGYISLIDKGIVQSVVKPKNQYSIKDSIFEEYLDSHKIPFNYYSNTSMELANCKIYFLNDTTNKFYNNFDSNNKSGIIKIVYGKNSFLFVGDAEIEAEEYLTSRYSTFLKSDVLKVGHHGSKTSSSDEFIEYVNPKIGIISAGVMNKFKHPSKLIIDKLKHRNIVIRRTDYEGAIILTSNGENINSINWRK